MREAEAILVAVTIYVTRFTTIGSRKTIGQPRLTLLQMENSVVILRQTQLGDIQTKGNAPRSFFFIMQITQF